MRQTIANYLDGAITFLLFIVAGLTPIFFLSLTTEFYSMPKLLLLVVATAVILGLWIFSWIIKGKISVTRTALDIPLLLLLLVVVASTYFSPSRSAAIYGNFPQVHGSAVAWVTYILLYFVTVSHLKSVGQIKNFLYTLYISGFMVALVTLLSFFHAYLPFDFAKTITFTPTGSSFSTVAFLMMLLPLPLLALLKHNRYMPMPLSAGLATLFGITIVLLGSVPSLVALVITFALCVFATKPHHLKKTLPYFLIPAVLTGATLVLAYLPMGNVNKLQVLEANFPKEIQLPFSVSWKISASAFRDAPFLGTGPSSYLFNFSEYKPAEFNTQDYWSFSFDSAYNEFLQVLGTLGIFGFVAVLALCLVVLNTSRRNISLDAAADEDDSTHLLLPSLSVAGVVAIVLLAIHATTLVSLVVTLFIFAVLMVSQRSVREKVTELSMGIKASTSGNTQFDLLPVIAFIVYVIAIVPVMYQTGTTALADYYHRQALVQANKSGTVTYQDLQKAETLNPYIDLYRVDMAQTNFALANALAAQKGPTQDNQKGSLTDQDKSTIQTLLSQAIAEARVGVVLSPLSARNWEVLAAIYRNISGVAQNALAFSLDAYGRAIQLDPINPALRVNVGGIYYGAKNYALATRYFTDAANLKPDYANAYYNLAIALRDSNDLTNAALVAQQLVNLLGKNTKTTDYQTANALLSDLKSKLANAQQQQTTAGQEQAPAAQTNSALQNPNLPNVTTLNNPPQVTPVPAVKPNPSANIPQVTPQPTK